MRPTDERKLTFEEEVERLLKTFTPLPKPQPAPKPKRVAVEVARKRWATDKRPLSAVLQDAQRAEVAATERLRREREAESDRIAAEHRRVQYQAEISAAWQRNLEYRRELAEWQGSGWQDSDFGESE
jgi:hypothetical protein